MAKPGETKGLEGTAFSSTSTYTIVQELGRGGMGIVYLAEKDCEGVIDHVVLKTIRTISPKQIERLKQEANIATELRHENIVKTYGLESIPISVLPAEFREQLQKLNPTATQSQELTNAGAKYYRPRLVPPKKALPGRKPGAYSPNSASAATSSSSHTSINTPVTTTGPVRRGSGGSAPNSAEMRDDEKLYCMAMDYVDGTDLGHLFRAHLRADLLLPCELTAFMISRICRALAYAHQFIVHRDISPENIMINAHGVAKLTDFGIAVAAGKQAEFAGKIMYMSPEQIQELDIDGRADIFSLGLVSYQMLTGINLLAPPRDASFEQAILGAFERMKQSAPPPHLVRPDVPEILSAIVMKMIAFDRADRYSSMEDAGNDLEKKYLYAKGFGPTNNSLAAYLRIFERDFKEYNQADLKQLTFLKSPETGKLALRRLFSFDTFSEVGRQLLKTTQKDQLAFKVLQRQARATDG